MSTNVQKEVEALKRLVETDRLFAPKTAEGVGLAQDGVKLSSLFPPTENWYIKAVIGTRLENPRALSLNSRTKFITKNEEASISVVVFTKEKASLGNRLPEVIALYTSGTAKSVRYLGQDGSCMQAVLSTDSRICYVVPRDD